MVAGVRQCQGTGRIDVGEAPSFESARFPAEEAPERRIGQHNAPFGIDDHDRDAGADRFHGRAGDFGGAFGGRTAPQLPHQSDSGASQHQRQRKRDNRVPDHARARFRIDLLGRETDRDHQRKAALGDGVAHLARNQSVQLEGGRHLGCRLYLVSHVGDARPPTLRSHRFSEVVVKKVLRADASDTAAPGAAFWVSKRLEHYGENPVDYPGLTRDAGRLFLGKDLRCAECHDHLFIDDYKQQDFQGLHTFFRNTFLVKAGTLQVGEKPTTEKTSEKPIDHMPGRGNSTRSNDILSVAMGTSRLGTVQVWSKHGADRPPAVAVLSGKMPSCRCTVERAQISVSAAISASSSSCHASAGRRRARRRRA